MFFRLFSCFILCLTLLSAGRNDAWAQNAATAGTGSKNVPVQFSADTLTRDEAAGTITASGHVEMEQDGRILKADRVVYHADTDKVYAEGNVELIDKNGDRHFADTIALTNKMQDSTATEMYSELKNGSRFWAQNGRRIAGKTITMKDAAYTPCEACKAHPEKPPIWQIKAGEVRQDEEDHRIVYKDATFDVLGLPVLYMPYFSHPDGTVKQKSGFLTPSAGYKSRQGLMLTNSYYMALSPYYDATLGLTVMSRQAPLVFGEYRRRFDNAQIKINSSLTYATRVDDINGADVVRDEKPRGHFFANGLWDINDKWRAGTDIEYASDDQYLRQYGFSSKDVLENQVYVERFSGRDYAVARALNFQDLRIQDLKTDQPAVLPQIQANFLGEPGETLGGRWSASLSTLGLFRDGSGQDLDRLSAEAGWQRRLVSDLGLVTKVDLNLRGDTYYVHDRAPVAANPALDDTGTSFRGFAQANVMTSYPLVKQIRHAQAVIEPTAALTVSPHVNDNNAQIPNEDSRDVQLDVSNIFEPNRFPGYDRVEDKIHATYGVRTGLFGDQGSKGEVFVGQSYRFDGDNNPFPVGSGLSNQYSDLVGQITASYKNRYNFDYRFELDSSDYQARRHEISSGAIFGKLTVGAQYLFVKPIVGTTLTENREQVNGNIAYKISDAWRVSTNATQDLGVNHGLRMANFGVDYLGQCFNVSGTLQRNLTDDSSGVSNTVLMLRMGLKNLGQFSTSGINLNEQAGKTASTSTTGSATAK